ncbi:MAG: OmpH family outer membrane protein [Bacteroidota bacterium]
MYFKQLLLTFSVLFIFLGAEAQQSLKIGHVNIQELAQKHPAMDSIKNVVDAEAKEMEKLYGELLTEHENKLKVFETESAAYSDFIKKEKEKELIEFAQKIQTYNQTAQQQLQRRNMELLRPIYEQINQEITNIAGHNNFTYILDVSNGAVAYISPESEDITPLVLENLTK